MLDDVDPAKAAADAAYACFSSMGQLCVSIERIYVERGVAAEFLREFRARTSALTLGAGFDYTADVGSLTSPAQFDRVVAHVADAVAKGATVEAGGQPTSRHRAVLLRADRAHRGHPGDGLLRP